MRTASLLLGSAFFSLLVSARVSNSHRRSLDPFEIFLSYLQHERRRIRRRALHVQRATLLRQLPFFAIFPQQRRKSTCIAPQEARRPRHRLGEENNFAGARTERRLHSQVQRTTTNFSQPATPWPTSEGSKTRRKRDDGSTLAGNDRPGPRCEQRDRNLHGKSERQRRKMAKREEKSVARNYNKGSIVGRFFPFSTLAEYPPSAKPVEMVEWKVGHRRFHARSSPRRPPANRVFSPSPGRFAREQRSRITGRNKHTDVIIPPRDKTRVPATRSDTRRSRLATIISVFVRAQRFINSSEITYENNNRSNSSKRVKQLQQMIYIILSMRITVE